LDVFRWEMEWNQMNQMNERLDGTMDQRLFAGWCSTVGESAGKDLGVYLPRVLKNTKSQSACCFLLATSSNPMTPLFQFGLTTGSPLCCVKLFFFFVFQAFFRQKDQEGWRLKPTRGRVISSSTTRRRENCAVSDRDKSYMNSGRGRSRSYAGGLEGVVLFDQVLERLIISMRERAIEAPIQPPPPSNPASIRRRNAGLW
jgi:hypothetical protein